MAKDVSLTPDLYMALLDSERKLAGLPELYDKAEECGVDCQQLRQVREMFLERSRALRTHFAPTNANKLNITPSQSPVSNG